MVRVFKEAGYLEEDACRWGQVPHREKTLLSEIPFGDLSESWLATFSQPGEAFESPAY